MLTCTRSVAIISVCQGLEIVTATAQLALARGSIENTIHISLVSTHIYKRAKLTSSTGTICDKHGFELPPGTPPTPWSEEALDDWSPYGSQIKFEVTDFLYHRNQMSEGDINVLLNLWVASLVPHGDGPPFRNQDELYGSIDATTLGDVPWQSFTLYYTGQLPNGPVPSWMEAEYYVWYRDPRKLIHNLISNPDFKDEFDYMPFHEYVDGKHHFQDFMSEDWAWKQAVGNLS